MSETLTIKTVLSYPFSLYHEMPANLGCNSSKSKQTQTPQKVIVKIMVGAKLRN